MYKVYLKPGKEESLKRFHPWVFSGAIAHFWDFPGRQAGKRLFSPPSPFFLFFLFGSQMAQGAGGLFVVCFSLAFIVSLLSSFLDPKRP